MWLIDDQYTLDTSNFGVWVDRSWRWRVRKAMSRCRWERVKVQSKANCVLYYGIEGTQEQVFGIYTYGYNDKESAAAREKAR